MLQISKSSPKTFRLHTVRSPKKKDVFKNVGNLLNSEEQLNLKHHHDFQEANKKLVTNIKKSLKLMIVKNVNVQRLRYTENQINQPYL